MLLHSRQLREGGHQVEAALQRGCGATHRTEAAQALSGRLAENPGAERGAVWREMKQGSRAARTGNSPGACMSLSRYSPN